MTDADFGRPSYEENGEGYFLTRAVMSWFWDLYCPPAQRGDPRAAPLRGNLKGLPPACIATCEFDPLRDEGIAYAEGLSAAGVPVESFVGRGQFHSSYMMVDVVVTGVAGRLRMAQALRRFAHLPADATANDDKAQRGDRAKAFVNAAE